MAFHDLSARHTTVYCRWNEEKSTRYIYTSQSVFNCPAAAARYYDDYNDVATIPDCTAARNQTGQPCGYGRTSSNGAFRHWTDFGQRLGQSNVCAT